MKPETEFLRNKKNPGPLFTPEKKCSPPYFRLKKSFAPSSGMSKNLLAPLFSWKKSLPPFLSQKKTRCPLFFAEKLGAPFFSLKKVVALFFYLKKSRRPSVDKPGPGTPINFGRSLMPVTFSPEITRFTLWLSQHQVPATFFTIKLYVPYVDVP